MQILKSNFLMKITHFTSIDNSMKETSSEIIKAKAKDFYESINEGQKNGVNYTIQVVGGPPKEIQFDAIYVRADGKFVWVYKKDDA